MKMQKYPVFVKKSLKINMLNTKNIVNLEIIVIIQVNIEVIFDIFNWEYSIPKKTTMIFQNGCNSDYYFIKMVRSEIIVLNYVMII